MKKILKKEVPGKNKKENLDTGNGSNGVSVQHLVLTHTGFTRRDAKSLFDTENKNLSKNKEDLVIVETWDDLYALPAGTTVIFNPIDAEAQ